MSTTNEEEVYHGTTFSRPVPQPAFAPAPLNDDPSVIIPKIMADTKLTPAEREAFLMRYMNARDDRNEKTLRARASEMQNAMRYAERQDATLRQTMGGVGAPYPGGYGMGGYPPPMPYMGAPYPPPFSPYAQGYQPSPWSAAGLSDSILSPITSTLSLIQVLLRGVIVLFSWTVIFYIARFLYRIFF